MTMAKFESPGDLELKIQHKRNRLLALVRRFPGISRQDCAIQLRISTYSVSHMTRDLLRENILREEALDQTGRSVGRPSQPLYLQQDHAYFAGVDLEANAWRLVIIDFAGNDVFCMEQPFGARKNRNAYVRALKNLLARAMGETPVEWKRVTALGIGAPGFIDHARGTVIEYELLDGFADIPLLELYRKAADRPTCLTWNLRNLATYQTWKEPQTTTGVTLHVAVRSGVGAVLSYQGRVMAGGSNRAGELGMFPLLGAAGRGVCIDRVSGLAALRESLPRAEREFWNGEPDAIAAQWKRKGSRTVLLKAMRVLGRALAGVGALLDPNRIMVYGSLFQHDTILWQALREEFEKSLAMPTGIPLMRSSAPASALATGAALHAMETQYPVE